MGKALRLVFKHLRVILLLSVVFLTATRQGFPSTEKTFPVDHLEAVPAIHPKLNFSTYFGGSSGLDHGHSIAVTEDDSCYVIGQTASSDFPTKNAYNSTFSGDRDAFVAKFSGSGSLLWSTFFGGSDLEVSRDISVAGDGSCYVIGSTLSNDFPTKNAYSSNLNGNEDTFLAKFSTNGSLLWSTYLGGSEEDYGYSIAVASDGSCYVTGETRSSDFPTQNAYDSTYNGGFVDAFVSKFTTNGTLLWSSYLGGNGNEAGKGIAVASDGSCYVTGRTRSSNFPTLDAYDATPNGDWDVFITKFSSNGSLLRSTFLGGAGWDEALSVTVAKDDSCYATGFTVSPNFPTKHAYSNSNSGRGDAFVVKFAATGSLLWSTFLGGNGGDRGYDIETSSEGSCYVTGETFSTNFPTRNTTSDSLSSGYDAFVTKFSSEGFLLWSTYHGGSQTDKGYGITATDDGSCYVIGTTHSPDFPTKNALDNTLGDSSDAFIAKFDNTPKLATQPSVVNGFLIFIAVMPTIAFMLTIAFNLYKKRK